MAKAVLKGKLTMDDSVFHASLRKATSAAKAFGSNLGSTLKSAVTSPISAVGAAIAGALTFNAFKSGIAGAIEIGTELSRLSRTTGIAVGALATLKPLFGQAGLGSDAMAGALKRMERGMFNAAKAGRTGQTVYREIGLNFEALSKLAPEEQFKSIGSAIDKLATPAAKIGASMAIFGRTGADLIGVFSQIANSDFGDISKKAKFLQENAALFEQTTLAIRKASGALKSVYFGAAKELAPFIISFSKLLSGVDALAFGQKLGQGIRAVSEIIAGVFVNPWKAVGIYFTRYLQSAARFGNLVVNGFLTGWAYVGAAMEFGVRNIVGIFTNGFMEGVESVLNFMVRGFSTAVDLLADGIANIWNGGGSISDAIQKALKDIKGFFTQTKNTDSFGTILDKYKGVLGVGKDWFGAESLGRSVSKSMAELRAGGRQFIDRLTGATGKAGGIFDPFAKFSEFTTTGGSAVQGASMVDWAAFDRSFHGASAGNQPGQSLTTGGINWGAYNQTNLLGASERHRMEAMAVAKGEATNSATSSMAHHAIRSGDHARMRAYKREQEREKFGLDKTNDILGGILGVMKDSWE